MVKYRLICNAYLTVLESGGHYYNRHFPKGVVCGKEAELEFRGRKYVILKAEGLRLFVTKERLKECFELEWGDTRLMK